MDLRWCRYVAILGLFGPILGTSTLWAQEAGEKADGRMILSRQATVAGKTIHQRMVWYNVSEHALDWNWERSDDGGETWQVQWKIHYARR